MASYRSPQMQAKRVTVNVIFVVGVVLDYNIYFIPKHIFNETHFFPCRRAFAYGGFLSSTLVDRDANVFPSCAIRCDASKKTFRVKQSERTVVP